MKIKVKKYFITYLSAMLILSNFSYATTLVFCSMEADHPSCSCIHNNQTEKSGIVIKSVSKSCCDKTIVELSNTNVLEILHSNPVNPLINADQFSSVNSEINVISANYGRIFSTLSYHPPNSEIPIINSSLLI